MTHTNHEIGTCYLSTYWNQAYLVIGTDDSGWCPMIVVLWEDNEIGRHATHRDNDPILKASYVHTPEESRLLDVLFAV